MNTPEIYNFEVTQNNFNSIALMNSYKLPVFTLFMSPSIGNCVSLEKSLGTYAKEFAGKFILARVDVDMSPELRDEYEIKNVPTIKVIKNGDTVHQEIGMLNEDELSDLFKTFDIYRVSDNLRQQARDAHINGNTTEAIKLLTQAIQEDPSSTHVALDMIQILLDINVVDQAKSLFNKLPDSAKDSDIGKSIIGQITFKDLANNTEGLLALVNKVQANPMDFDARFDLAVCYVAEHAYEEALNQVFEILDNEHTYREGAAQELSVSIINMLEANEPELAKEARRVLSNMISQ
ncbi:tetratricopeptide repeat protein [Thiomicrorhabdus sp. Milos-T2]|uniref:tetratricopeptide repeat protein n=1 Tax=Thiomicrorhabdus sp. Milos-T2 TaxID=90814 RepID=UPI00049482C6|nr:tetratricopeptide repeat protein [Thiomicrorhabdus sp. Milos-T2]